MRITTRPGSRATSDESKANSAISRSGAGAVEFGGRRGDRNIGADRPVRTVDGERDIVGATLRDRGRRLIGARRRLAKTAVERHHALHVSPVGLDGAHGAVHAFHVVVSDALVGVGDKGAHAVGCNHARAGEDLMRANRHGSRLDIDWAQYVRAEADAVEQGEVVRAEPANIGIVGAERNFDGLRDGMSLGADPIRHAVNQQSRSPARSSATRWLSLGTFDRAKMPAPVAISPRCARVKVSNIAIEGAAEVTA